MKAIYHTRLQNLKAILAQQNVDAFVLPVNDEFFSEYPPEHFKRLAWLTGFTGSAGTVIITPQKSAFFTDGRYTLQAQQQVDDRDYTLYNSGELSPLQWLEKNQPRQIGISPWLFSVSQLRKWQAKLPNAQWAMLSHNPIDTLWHDRPALSSLSAFDYPLQYAGLSREEKLTGVAGEIKKQKADALLLTLPESICWLLNIRGRDVAHTPLLLCRALVYANGDYELFADPQKLPAMLRPAPYTLEEACEKLSGKTVVIDPTQTPAALLESLSAATLIEAEDPCTLPKACKNDTELSNIKATHIADGAALTRFFHWLNTTDEKLTEISASDRLDLLRAENPDFLEPSFPTISGFGDHGAIVHYRATEESNRSFAGDTLYLVDSGGQYWGGTTDVTRTLSWGVSTADMRRHYTLVLKGHIALARAVFPVGSSGRQLDTLARQYLWQEGLDYDHGTGHGVGCFLGVHEGPQRISKLGSDVSLQPGMLLSNEPGYYRTGAYGIRIENLVVVKESSRKGFLEFETLTCAPMDKQLVEKSLLEKDEIDWWNSYHDWVYRHLTPLLEAESAAWLAQACKPL